VSCNEMNVTNIFADNQRGNNMEILCKAATIAQQGQSCHRYLEGIYHNLLSLVWGIRARHKKPCPVAADSTTSLKNFLKEL
ncbi:IL4 protein, partial [Cisticola juncidis]|nr:IL4 protein [Cisticola juncidis]